MAEGNSKGWTFDTALTLGAVVTFGVVMWIKTGREGDTKAVDVAMRAADVALTKTASSSAKEFDDVRREIKELAKAVAEGLSGLNTALKLIAGLGTVAGIGAVIFFQ